MQTVPQAYGQFPKLGPSAVPLHFLPYYNLQAKGALNFVNDPHVLGHFGANPSGRFSSRDQDLKSNNLDDEMALLSSQN